MPGGRRFITSFLRKQGGWARWNKAVRQVRRRELHGGLGGGLAASTS